MAQSEEIRLEQQASTSPARVWEALTRPALWWNEGVRLDPRIGGKFLEPWNDGAVERCTTGSITEIEPPHRLAMSWKDQDWVFETSVDITVAGEGDHAIISLRHRGWEAAPAEERARLIADHRSGWSQHLGKLAACAESMTEKRREGEVTMDLTFKVSGRIAKPVAEVFEAVVNPDHLSHYFTTGGAKGRLETGATVTWDFADFPGAFPVKVEKVVPNKQIVLHWGAADDAPEGEEFKPHDTTVIMDFEQLDDGRTLVTITEGGWRETPKGLKASYGNCEGWTGMFFAMKVWLEHGLNLREGTYK